MMRFPTIPLLLALSLPTCSGAEEGEARPRERNALPTCSATATPAPPARLDAASLGAPTFSDEFRSFDRWDGKRGTWRTNYGYKERWSYTLGKQEQIAVDTSFKGTGDAPLGINPFRVEDGVLHISGDRAPPGFGQVAWGYQYTSGMLTTRPTFSQCHGYFEIRAKLPKGRGLWPAFWLLPKNKQWPPEIDVFEMIGHEPDVIHTTVHWGPDASGAQGAEKRKVARKRKQKRTFRISTSDASADFHAYGVWWDANRIAWYLDGEKVAETEAPPGTSTPMFMLVTLAIGGSWPGPPDKTTAFPAVMSIDHIRAYRLPGRGTGGD